MGENVVYSKPYRMSTDLWFVQPMSKMSMGLSFVHRTSIMSMMSRTASVHED